MRQIISERLMKGNGEVFFGHSWVGYIESEPIMLALELIYFSKRPLCN